MLALSIRQPFAELILRGIKTVEYRSRRTGIIGERFHIYGPKGPKARREDGTKGAWSYDLSGRGGPPGWMIELAEQVGRIEPDLEKLGEAIAMLPAGVGSSAGDRMAERMRSWIGT